MGLVWDGNCGEDRSQAPLWIAEVFVSVEYLKLPMSITTEAQNFAPTVRKKFLGSAAMRPGPG